MPMLTDIYENTNSPTILQEPDNFSPQGVGNSSPRSFGPGQYVDLVKRFGDGQQVYADKGGFEDNSGFGLGFREPYVWVSPADSDTIKNIKRYDNRAFPLGSTIQDLIRIGKFTASGKGILWLAKQQLLHQQAPHDETNIVDPTSHLLSAARPASLNAIPRVTKHISGGSALGGILSLFGSTQGEPKSTVDPDTIPDGLHINKSQSSFGLLRGNTATKARERWGPEFDQGSGGNGGILGRFISGLFGQSFSAAQPNGVNSSHGTIYRADQDRYDREIIIADKNQGFLHKLELPSNLRGSLVKFVNATAGSRTVTFNYNIYNSESKGKVGLISSDSERISVPQGSFGFDGSKSYQAFLDSLDDNSFIIKFRNRWQDSGIKTTSKGNFGIKHIDNYNTLMNDWINSRFSDLSATDVTEPSRGLTTDSTSIPSQNNNRDDVYEKKIVQSETEVNSRLSRFYQSMVGGNLTNTSKPKGKERSIFHQHPVNSDASFVQNLNDKFKQQTTDENESNVDISPYFQDVIKSTNIQKYLNSGLISKMDNSTINERRQIIYKMGSYNSFVNPDDRIDKLNSQGIIKYGESGIDDFIKFMFHDIVNEKVAFFRATLKSISDNLTPEWSDIKYIGRADKLYVYNGMTRSISFNFRVYASSKKEMRPMWQRINYLYGMGYPSKITQISQYAVNIPPYVKLTIGNLYKNQPIIINNISITVPDEATWEIDQNMQLPMMVEISIQSTLLEKEAPRTNVPHFDEHVVGKYLLAEEDNQTSSEEALAIDNRENEQNSIDPFQNEDNSEGPFV